MKATRRLAFLALAGLLPACGGGGGGGGGGGAPAPLQVTELKPADLATGVIRTRNLYARVNRAAQAATVTNANVILRSGITPIGRTISYDALNRLIVIDPTDPLSVTTTYTVELTAGVTDLAGVALTPVTYTFTTSGNVDDTSPSFPAAGFDTTARTLSSITLGWNAATDATAYEIFIIPSTGIFDPTADPDVTVAGLTHTFNTLNSDTRFEYRIRAVDAAGNISPEFHPELTKTLTGFTQDVYGEIIQVRCLLCHAPGGPFTPPFFMATRQEAYERLAGKVGDPSYNDSFCSPNAPAKRVVAGDTANSFLWRKINPAPPCGDRMPLDGPTLGFLSGTQIQTIGDWILEGALDN
jgi:hypothetical protein